MIEKQINNMTIAELEKEITRFAKLDIDDSIGKKNPTKAQLAKESKMPAKERLMKELKNQIKNVMSSIVLYQSDDYVDKHIKPSDMSRSELIKLYEQGHAKWLREYKTNLLYPLPKKHVPFTQQPLPELVFKKKIPKKTALKTSVSQIELMPSRDDKQLVNAMKKVKTAVNNNEDVNTLLYDAVKLLTLFHDS